MLDDTGRDQIRSEIEDIQDIFIKFGSLLSKSETAEPDLIELSALGTVLHSFYTGLEGIFLVIVKRIGAEVPTGNRWHMDLLEQISRPTDSRDAVISESTRLKLESYLAFRHFFRHSYAYILEWDEMRELIVDLRDTWDITKQEIEIFLQTTT